MRSYSRSILFFLFAVLFSLTTSIVSAESGTSSGTITGTVTDPSGSVVPGATVTILNPVSEYTRTTTADSAGHFQLPNVPFNPYHLTVQAAGFATFTREVIVRSVVPVTVTAALQIGETGTTVTVQGGGDLLENDPTFHTDVDRSLFRRLPLQSQSSSVSSLVTLSTPGVASDSNGLFHGLGDHAQNSFSVDGQPITDQQSKVFSNQLPLESIQALEVIDGAPPAEYGDKTSLVIKVTTRSGQGLTKPTGSIYSSYGTFGSVTGGLNLGYGRDNWGNFFTADGLRTGRFLDPPEFKVFHARGNLQNLFDRIDYNLTQADSVHLNLNYSRSWFQTPNSYDNLNVLDQSGNSVGATDQRSKIETFNISPTYTRVIGTSAVLNFGAFVRKDAYNYYPSHNPLADLGPPSLQRETVAQYRTLTNAGVHSDISYVKGIHTAKLGAVYEQTFLKENFGIGIVDPILNAPCVNANGDGVAGFTDPSQCTAAGYQPNTSANPNAPNSVLYPNFNPVLLPYDLTRGGSNYIFNGRTDVKQLAMYLEDQIKAGNWSFNLGIRGDLYNGLTRERQAQPRVGIAYSIKPSNTVLRVSYGRMLETPFNENLVLSSNGAEDPVISALVPSGMARLNPGFRNEFHAGLQQAFGRYFVVSGDYIWKYTHNAFDFSVLGNTPITFPIEWDRSKIPGWVLRADVPKTHGVTAFVVMSSVAARFFTPQVGGLGVVPGGTAGAAQTAFRIDHDERFNQTTHVQYQPWARGPWMGFNWRYDSGLVAGSTPCYADSGTCAPSSTTLNGQPAVQMVSNNVFGVPLTAAQEAQAGFFCGSQRATPTQALPFVCPASQFGSTLISVPAPGTQDDDHNPQRIRPRSLFDTSLGEDNIFNGDRYKWGARVSVINLTNKTALYNFLSTFSGTHYVTPRAINGQISFSF